MVVQCFFMFLAGFVLGFTTALVLIVGIVVLPVVLGLILILGVFAYLKHRKEQRRREEYREFWGE